jgi:hypothetical protein
LTAAKAHWYHLQTNLIRLDYGIFLLLELDCSAEDLSSNLYDDFKSVRGFPIAETTNKTSS